MDESEVKIVIGQAAGRAHYLDHAERTIPMLQRLFEDPQTTELERVRGELLGSDNRDEHTVAFILQAALQTDLPDPAPIAWRDLALDIRELEITVADYMYRLEQEMENKDKVTESEKPAMVDMYRALQGRVDRSRLISGSSSRYWNLSGYPMISLIVKSPLQRIGNMMTMNPKRFPTKPMKPNTAYKVSFFESLK